MKTKTKNREKKRVQRALASFKSDRKYGFTVEKGREGSTFCRNCEEWNTKFEYTGTTWTLTVADCFSCGTTNREAFGGGGMPERRASRLFYLYGERAETVLAELKKATEGRGE